MSSRDRTKLEAIKRSSEPLELFLDDGGVLNDNSLRGPEWLRLIGEFMPGRLGGTADQWTRANRVVFPHVCESIQKRLPGFATHQEFLRGYATSWMSAMCAHVGVKPPPDDDAVALHNELTCYVWERADSAIAGAPRRPYSLCTGPDSHCTRRQEERRGSSGASCRRWALSRRFRACTDQTLWAT